MPFEPPRAGLCRGHSPSVGRHYGLPPLNNAAASARAAARSPAPRRSARPRRHRRTDGPTDIARARSGRLTASTICVAVVPTSTTLWPRSRPHCRVPMFTVGMPMNAPSRMRRARVADRACRSCSSAARRCRSASSCRSGCSPGRRCSRNLRMPRAMSSEPASAFGHSMIVGISQLVERLSVSWICSLALPVLRRHRDAG